MKKLSLALVLALFGVSAMLAQRTVMGTVTGDDGTALIGATVLIKGTTSGTITDIDGKYSINVPTNDAILVFSFTGFTMEEVRVGASNVVDVVMKSGQLLEEVVVTALGISRYKNELPYSAQKVDGADVTNVRDNNIVNTLSGRVAGLNVKRNNNLGGSTNIVLRGSKSLVGDNQALFVIDGVPVDNSNTNTNGGGRDPNVSQTTGRGGFDYGNAAADINPDDVESVTILKGAAASALYGSRASNGVVMITTKKGRAQKGLGVSINTGINFGKYDKSTFLKYQDKYGAGYGPFYEDDSGFFFSRDVDGDGNNDLVTPLTEDASWGAAFDPNLLVYQWDAFDITSPNYHKARPWVAAKNDPSSMFQTSIGASNSVIIDGSNENGYFKAGYTRTDDRGIMPNSSIEKNLVNLGAGYNFSKRLSVGGSINFTNTKGKGRYGTGYDSKNLMTNFRQWWQVNVDIDEQKEAYDRNKNNVTWNWADPNDLVPIYWDNPWWTRYENYQNDSRNRYFGYLTATYKLTDWLSLVGRVSLDQYNELQEERTALGSVDVSQYSRFNRSFQEINYDLMAQMAQRNIGDKLKFDALIGTNIRKNQIQSIRAITNGGLAIPRVYALTNTKNLLEAPEESLTELEVDGVFAKAGFVYDRWAILDLTVRRDQASSLPSDNNSYIYPSASLGFVFSEFMTPNDNVTFGKLRLNYAEVGNTAPPLSVTDVYDLNTGFGDAGMATVRGTKNNPDLKSERTKSFEAGLEMRFLKDKVGFDVTYYKMNTIDQIIPVPVSRSTGYNFKYINAGDIENRGFEVYVFLRPVKTPKFSWRTEINWARNRNEVKDLGGIQNLQLASFQGGVTINAALGEPYGTIKGQNFVYLDGKKVVGANGRYLRSATSDEIIGNVNPDWTGGINNIFNFMGINFSFLIDVKKGGDLFSLDQYYGLATGLSERTAGKNDLGNDLRLPLDEGGGIINEGVLADGTPNTNRVGVTDFGWFGYRRQPAAAFIYDASFVKLREVNIGYELPASLFTNSRSIKGVSLGIYGRNLWIIHKNLPDADPEDGLSSGNVQGYQVGSYPSVRTVGVNLNLKF